MAENIRETALDTLILYEKEGGLLSTYVKDVLDKYDYLDRRDKSFIKRVTEGAVERKIELDYYINLFSKTPTDKMKPLIRNLFRMTAYQIIYMDQVPDYSAINEALKLMDKRKFHNLKGFANAVLRKISSNKDALVIPDANKEPVQYLSVRYSMPIEVVLFFMENYSFEETNRIFEAVDKVHPVSIRFKSTISADEMESYVDKMNECGATVKPSPLNERVFLVSGNSYVRELPGYDEGVFVVQDASSVLAVEALCIQKDDFVMDVCAAPGGKTMLAAEKADSVLSRDLSLGKVEKINENIRRMRYTNIETECHDATVFDEKYREKADVLILDVPCSGLGVMGKKRDIKYNFDISNVNQLNLIQKDIVNNCFDYLKKGGRLLYSTCTINPLENEEMVQYIESSFPVKRMGEMKQFLPGTDDCDGFFYTVFERV